MVRSDKTDLHDMWELMPPETQRALSEAIEILAGSGGYTEDPSPRYCPRCGGSDTTDCHTVKYIQDPSIGLCVTCGYLWCLECGAHLISTVTCGHWRICANCGVRKDESGYCRALPSECSYVKDWLERSNPRA